jgi:hypothetical protein
MKNGAKTKIELNTVFVFPAEAGLLRRRALRTSQTRARECWRLPDLRTRVLG